ncbi:MAG: hypothetical protein LBG04_01070 [Holosporaceae bacterium]|jgi:hypothetical protein|nr:hypothetical protein [Holosporaceae bacterium]
MVNSRIIALAVAAMATLSADGMSVLNPLNDYDASAQAPCASAVRNHNHSPSRSRDGDFLVGYTISQWQLKPLAQNGVNVSGQTNNIESTENPDGTITLYCTESQYSMLEKALKLEYFL